MAWSTLAARRQQRSELAQVPTTAGASPWGLGCLLRRFGFSETLNSAGECSLVVCGDGEGEDVAYVASGELAPGNVHQLIVARLTLYPDPSVWLTGWLADKAAVGFLAHYEDCTRSAALLIFNRVGRDERKVGADG